MTIQKYTPPFTYSYQCGSTLLTTYIPIYMYSFSLQLVSIMLILCIIYTSNSVTFPRWILNISAGVCWPRLLGTNLPHVNSHDNSNSPTIRLIHPSLILSQLMNNLIILLTFGLCSPILASYITINLCIYLSSWIVLIGRFIMFRLSSISDLNDKNDPLNSIDMDPFIPLLNSQVEGVHLYLRASKRPIILTSCFFFTLICWDIAGDKVGWYHSLWVPGSGFLMAVILLLWNRLLLSKLEIFRKLFSNFFFIISKLSSSSISSTSPLPRHHGSDAVELTPSTISPHHDSHQLDHDEIF